MNYEFHIGVDIPKDSFTVRIKDSKGKSIFQVFSPNPLTVSRVSLIL
jgi:hypothetical protein